MRRKIKLQNLDDLALFLLTDDDMCRQRVMGIAQNDSKRLTGGVIDAGVDRVVQIDGPVLAPDITCVLRRLFANRDAPALLAHRLFLHFLTKSKIF